ncbi:NAD-glutamate dehydrogenase domain-containing protein [Terasakiella sp. SH-1]|uniref:NAD-glutamate dehydrogenase domain-containing protein n=1 Tax=Terasakiella sp. SH-1 TaxID=2560057 RepID=UPI00197E0E07|nr:NAD-glutamate dehydrogenase domain-containing protein [Terasakiella sp. SH-1]
MQLSPKDQSISVIINETSGVHAKGLQDCAAEKGGMAACYDLEGDDNRFGLVIFDAVATVALSRLVPILESTGLYVLTEEPLFIRADSHNAPLCAHDVRVQFSAPHELSSLENILCDLIEGGLNRTLTIDGFNSLLTSGGLGYREIDLLRAYFKYMKQLQAPFSQEHVEEVLVKNCSLASSLVDLFYAKFSPEIETINRSDHIQSMEAAVEAHFETVGSAHEEEILKIFYNLIRASLRTNFFQKEARGAFKSYISIKFDCAHIELMPLPKPKFEVFVFSNKVEGVHLRGGKVARGGLRWSDRVDDYRTEILGLVKAQMVKNAVIVPDGAKGGFIAKTPDMEPRGFDRFAYGKECYKTFISALLDVTDNIVEGKAVPPENTIRYDEDDTYLVVAADKGTATFSDIANGISQDYGFWLGDAFASGGSNGYDHKKMGITAKGAWEAVKRHFREMNCDTQNEEFTVIGIGDMSGDVFGNGMLLSDKIRLVAAFDHRHIFIDPSPNAAKSFQERKRLFEMEISNWASYDKSLLSEGGGVYDRTSKKIELSEFARQALNLTKHIFAPDELISAILKASVDLLWFGGIGTYIRASDETNQDAGDRANDSVRISAGELNCKVIGEGANLGMTQKARIEFARSGGRMNTDAIDNAAGVNCSDHEVNIKILLGQAVQAGKLTEEERNELLVDMTDDVSKLVLRDNYLQTQALSISQQKAFERLDRHMRVMQVLSKGERGAYLDRQIEALPDDEELFKRQNQGKGLSRPELAVLLSYTKMAVYNELLNSDFPDQAILGTILQSYFPERLQKRFPQLIKKHPLRREIITTKVVNSMINRVGSGFINDMQDYVGCEDRHVATAYATMCRMFGLLPLWQEIESLDLKVTAQTQVRLMNETIVLVEQGTHWLLRKNLSETAGNIFDWAERLDVQKLSTALIKGLNAKDQAQYEDDVESFCNEGVPEALAARILSSRYLLSLFAAAEVCEKTGKNEKDVVKQFYQVGDAFSLGMLREKALDLSKGVDRWERSAFHALNADFLDYQSDLTHMALSSPNELAQATRYLAERLEGLTQVQSPNLAILSVAAAAFRQAV